MAHSNETRGFNNIRNSQVEKRKQKKTVQQYTLIAIAGLAALTVAMLVVLTIGGIAQNIWPDWFNPNKGPAHEKVEWAERNVAAADTLHGPLVLVNADHKYTFPATDDHLGNLYDNWASHSPRIYKYSGLSKGHMAQVALEPLDQMLMDFHAATGKDNVILRYAYRSENDQQELLDKGSSTTPVGHSDHHTGMGIQLRYTNGDNTYLLSSDETYDWLYDNCHKYGFVVRYPEGKEEITGVEDYTDYFRYVGVAHATYMKANNLCMEEYVELLKTNYTDHKKPLGIEAADGLYYEVYYAAETLYYPTNYAYEVSGTNEGGVIVTIARSETAEPEAPADGNTTTTADDDNTTTANEQ